jgi:hypothetical protein
VPNSPTPEELAQEAIDLLLRILDESHEPNTEQEIRIAFIYRHARNIFELAQDVLMLERAGRNGSTPVIIRAMFEGLFNRVAAVKNPAFATDKMVSELEYDVSKLESWKDSDIQSGLDAWKNYAAKLRQEFAITANKKWRVLDCAKAAELESYYEREYFLFSSHAHTATLAVIAQEDNIGQRHRIGAVFFLAVCAAGHAAQILRTRTPQAHVDEAARLLHLATDLHEKGLFGEIDSQP